MSLTPTFASEMASYSDQKGRMKRGISLVARVTHVVQGPTLTGTDIPDKYYNDPTDLGSITYQLINGNQSSTLQSSGNPLAKPVFSAFKHYPLEGEFVYLIQGPSVDMNTSIDAVDYYYLPPFNLWGASHHNALPDLGDYQNYVNASVRDYQNSTNTNQPVNLTSTNPINYPLGPNFSEKSNLKNLEIFTGDVVLEGRWGNSIRLGSTNINPDANYWSATGSAGNPITIIRNGQGSQTNTVAWIPTIENINVDPSSIYLTNGQKIVVDDIDNNFSLITLGVKSQTSITTAIPIQQQLTVFDTLSPSEQDSRVNSMNS